MKRGRFLFIFCLAAIMLAVLNIAIAEEDRLTIKFHSSGDGKNVSIELAKYLPYAEVYYHSKVQNVTIFMKGSVVTIVPRIGWVGDEIITFFVNKSVEEEIAKKEKLRIMNLEPIVEMSFPAMKTFVASPGEIEFSVIAFDPDNDVVRVDWLVDGKLEKQEQAQGGIVSHFIYNQTPAVKAGLLKKQQFRENLTRYVVNAIVNDSKSSKIIEWHFNVVNQTCIDIWQCTNWSDCILGKRYRDCRKINTQCEFNTYKPPTEWLDPLCIQKQVECEPNWTCSEWQRCKLNYDAGIVLAGKIRDVVKLRQERLCHDASYCIGSVGLESRDCNETLPVKTRRVEWCNGKYIEIFNADTGQFISRIREFMPGELPSLDIELSLKELSQRDYCWYCYNGRQDHDETGVDCGGSCQECIEVSARYSILDFLPLALFIAADLLLAGYIIFWVRKR